MTKHCVRFSEISDKADLISEKWDHLPRDSKSKWHQLIKLGLGFLPRTNTLCILNHLSMRYSFKVSYPCVTFPNFVQLISFIICLQGCYSKLTGKLRIVKYWSFSYWVSQSSTICLSTHMCILTESVGDRYLSQLRFPPTPLIG